MLEGFEGFRLVAIGGMLGCATGAGVPVALGAFTPIGVDGALGAVGTPAIFTRISKVVTMFSNLPRRDHVRYGL
jgi:hypothetical protein